MVTRSTATKTQTAQAAAQATKPVIDTSITDDQQPASFMDMIRGAASLTGIEIPSNKMLFISSAVSIAAGVLSAYGTMQLGGYLAVGALMLTGSAFLAWAILIVATLIAAYAALLTVFRTFAYMASGSLEKDMTRARGWVTGFFTAKKVEASHA